MEKREEPKKLVVILARDDKGDLIVERGYKTVQTVLVENGEVTGAIDAPRDVEASAEDLALILSDAEVATKAKIGETEAARAALETALGEKSAAHDALVAENDALKAKIAAVQNALK